jgi:RNA polymerase sigma-70 factor, ECF subfamily
LARFANQPPGEELEQIYRSEHEGLYRYARRILNDPEEAHDVVQEAFLRFHAKKPGIDGQHAARPLLYTLVRNLSIDRVRRAGTRTRLFRDAAQAGSRPSPATPESGLIAREDRDMLRRALATLGARDLECLTLREAGLPYAEIGEVLIMPTSSVGPTIVRALAKLRKAFFALERQQDGSGPMPAARHLGAQ